MDENSLNKAAVLGLLESLKGYVEHGIHDYLHDNDVVEWLTTGEGLDDVRLLAAIETVSAFVANDDYPWWKE